MQNVVSNWTGTEAGVIDRTDIELGTLNTGDKISFAARGMDSSDARNLQRIYAEVLQIEAIPEPATLGLLGIGALITLLVRKIKYT